jgi:predicted ATPase
VAPALHLLDEFLGAVKEPGVGFYVPELHRLHGECLLRLDPDNVAVAVRSFETAIETATLQQAHIFRLAAAISLARAWAGAGRPEQGIAPLRQIVEILGDEDDVGQLAIAREMLSAQSP